MKKILCMALMLLSSELVHARTVTEIIDSKKLIVGISVDNPPLAYQDQLDKLMGFDVDMARSLAKSLNVDLFLLVVDKSRLADGLAADKFDIAMGISYSPDLIRQFLLSKRVIPDGVVALKFCQNPYQIRNVKALNSSNAIVMDTDAHIMSFAKKYMPAAIIYPQQYNINPIDLLWHRGTDIVITDLIQANYYQYYYPKLLCFATKAPIVGSRSYKVYMTQKNNTQLMKIINNWLRITNKQDIAEKWHINLSLS